MRKTLLYFEKLQHAIRRTRREGLAIYIYVYEQVRAYLSPRAPRTHTLHIHTLQSRKSVQQVAATCTPRRRFDSVFERELKATVARSALCGCMYIYVQYSENLGESCRAQNKRERERGRQPRGEQYSPFEPTAACI